MRAYKLVVGANLGMARAMREKQNAALSMTLCSASSLNDIEFYVAIRWNINHK